MGCSFTAQLTMGCFSLSGVNITDHCKNRYFIYQEYRSIAGAVMGNHRSGSVDNPE
jgi:hypothetical protein